MDAVTFPTFRCMACIFAAYENRKKNNTHTQRSFSAIVFGMHSVSFFFLFRCYMENSCFAKRGNVAFNLKLLHSIRNTFIFHLDGEEKEHAQIE